MTFNWEVCICGHAEHEHNFETQRGRILRTDCKSKTCGCNVWESIGKMNYQQWYKYKEDNEITDMFITSNENEVRV